MLKTYLVVKDFIRRFPDIHVEVLEPYYYTRSSGWKQVDLTKLVEELKEEYTIQELDTFDTEWDITMDDLEREQYKITSDTLTVRLAITRATLFQKEAVPFTQKDEKLKETIFRLYPRDKASILPLGPIKEPEYKVEEAT